MFSVLVIRLRSLRLLRVSGIVMRLRMFLLLITFLKASHSFRNRLLVICKNAYLFATMIMNSHTVLDGIITTIMATIQRINIIGSREGSRNRRRLKANQTGKKFRVGIKSNISTNRNNLISGVDRCIHL